MKDFNGTITYKGKEYSFVFNFNVMERIQEEYGTMEAWGELSDGSSRGEPDAKAIKFGFREMLNEGIDISNEENGTDIPLLTDRQVGRMITEFGVSNVAEAMNQTVIESTKSDEKNE